jgi:hypothetical protein
MICEECEENEAEVDVILDSQPKSICRKCASVTSGVVIQKPSQNQVDESKRMWRVKEILSRSAGIPYNMPKTTLPNTLRTVSLEDLRRVDRDKKSAYQLRAEGRMQREEEEASQKRAQEAGRIVEESKGFKDEVELVDE